MSACIHRADTLTVASRQASSPLDSFEHMFRRHVDAVWRSAVAMGVDADSAHDVVQEVFLAAHAHRDRFIEGRSPKAWLLGITRNVVRHHHRGRQRREDRHRRLPEPAPVELPAREVERREAAELVQAFIDQLDAKKKTVFVLGFVEGLSAKEIAQMLDLKLPTVYARARAAEAALARFVRRRTRRDGARP